MRNQSAKTLSWQLISVSGMTVRSFLKIALPIGLIAVLIFGIGYVKKAMPILSGYGAKNMCSCVMVGLRDPQDVLENELSSFPLNLGEFTMDYSDSSATGSVYGMAERKAIFRKGLGCTLISGVEEKELRKRKMRKPRVPNINQDTIPWPQGNLIQKAKNTQLDITEINNIVAKTFENPDSRRTRAILVIYNGQIIAEQYAQGFDKDSPQMGWSMAKSLTNAIVGSLVQRNKFRIEGPAAILEWKTDDRARITLDNLMRMSSGLTWNEKYSGPSSATNMLFNSRHMGIFAADTKLRFQPGEVFYYSSGTSNIISRLVRQIYNDDDYYRYPYEALFHKIGMNSLVLEPDAGGTFVGSSYAYASARDWGRFGLLFLNDGICQGERLLPEGWVKYSTTPTKGAHRGEYGAHFWLNAGAPGNEENRIYPDAPIDLYWADGFEGQNVFIIPSKQLVVVKLSQTTGDALDDNFFLKSLIAELPN